MAAARALSATRAVEGGPRRARGLACESMYAEILNARLRPGWKDADLQRLMAWNTEHHIKDGVSDVRYFISEDRTRFVMIIGYHDRAEMERLRARWEESGSESQDWFRKLVEPLFAEGQSVMYSEAKPL